MLNITKVMNVGRMMSQTGFRFVKFPSLTLLPHKGNISALQQAIVTNDEVALKSRKNTLRNGIQYNTFHFELI